MLHIYKIYGKFTRKYTGVTMASTSQLPQEQVKIVFARTHIDKFLERNQDKIQHNRVDNINKTIIIKLNFTSNGMKISNQ